MTPLEYMKKELAIMAGEYDKHLVDCALAIAEEYDREGHSGHSIGWFSAQFRTHTLIALKTKALGESTWLDHFKAKEVQLGAGDLTELATDQFYSRVAVLDKFEIRTLEDLETVLKLVTLYTKMEPVRRIDLKNKDNFIEQGGWDILYHVDDSRFYYDDAGQLWVSDLAAFSDNGGDGWFTSKGTSGMIDTDFDPQFRRYYILVDADRKPFIGTRTTTPGSVVRNVHGDIFTIDGIVSHPDTTQPYFKLLPMLRGEVDLTVDPLIVSSNSLIKGTIHVKELDMTLPIYHQWPADLETQ